jgi:diacylglycerol kinase (ATP)
VKSVTVLTNPHAGGGHPREVAAMTTARLQERRIEVVGIEGESAADALRRVGEAVDAGTDAVVAVGGDGLINIAWQALARTGVPLGIVPAGTGNDHARLLGIPVGAPIAAADIIADGHSADIDLGCAGGHWFGTVLASGFDSLVTERANRMRWPRGPLRYNVAMLAELARLHPIPYRIVLDDRTVDVEAALVSVGNGTSYGGGMHIAPGASVTDGLLDVVVAAPRTRFRLVRMFPTVYKGTHVDLDEVQVYRTRKVRLTARGIVAYADGERIAPLPIDVEAVPGAGRVLVRVPPH